MANLTGYTDAFKIQSHLMFFDTGLNSADTRLKNIYEAFVEAATKMWAYVRCLPQQKRPAAGLVARYRSCISGATRTSNVHAHLIRNRMGAICRINC